MEMHGAFEGSWQERTNLYALREVLSVRLRKKLREELGGVYGVSVSASTWTMPEDGYRFGVSFQCDPERVDELNKATWAVINDVLENGVEEDEVADVRAKKTRSMEESLETNGFFLGIESTLRRGEDPLDMMKYTQRIEALNADVIHQAAKTWINPKQFVAVTRLPEAEAE